MNTAYTVMRTHNIFNTNVDQLSSGVHGGCGRCCDENESEMMVARAESTDTDTCHRDTAARHTSHHCHTVTLSRCHVILVGETISLITPPAAPPRTTGTKKYSGQFKWPPSVW